MGWGEHGGQRDGEEVAIEKSQVVGPLWCGNKCGVGGVAASGTEALVRGMPLPTGQRKDKCGLRYEEWVCTASSGSRLGLSRGAGKCEGGQQRVGRRRGVGVWGRGGQAGQKCGTGMGGDQQ